MSHFHNTGVLLVNLGTPASPTPADVRVYLREFLSDPRVVQLPRWLWLPLLNGVILPIRSSRSAAAYAKVWTEEGSPLTVFSEAIAAGLAQALESEAQVRLAMRYGQPSVRSVLEDMKSSGVEKLVVLPLYPQYSNTTTGTVCDAVDAALSELNWDPQLHRVCDYFAEPAWVAAVAGSIRRFQQEQGRGEKLLFSMHGIPERYVRQGDPYQDHCERSIRAIVAELGLADDEWMLTYQSRFGREPWLQPYTDITLEELAADGVRHVQVVCPGFAADCLETLEEIAMENRDGFVEAGGERLDYIPALNDDPDHVAALAGLARSIEGISCLDKCNRRCKSPAQTPG